MFIKYILTKYIKKKVMNLLEKMPSATKQRKNAMKGRHPLA
jgi:hypothetical protein